MKRLLLRIMPKNRHIYNFCRDYVDRCNGDNNGDIFTNGEYRLMRETFGACSTVFDVGAYKGEWTQLALDINPDLAIHCFEPSSESFRALEQKGFPGNVRLNNKGLSSSREDRLLYLFGPGEGINSLYLRKGLEAGWSLEPQKETEAVSLDTLDEYCRERSIAQIDFLKIDVEGHELEVLKGARTMITNKRVAMIQFEYGGCNIDSRTLLADIFDYFDTAEYRFFKLHPDRLHPVPRYDQRLENFHYQNWLAVRKDFALPPALLA
ncbi:MAG: FkbM family methyltransferase [Deltaproteobacteria bacterium]|nr:FkbM family methyltransferase [Deltaproteobacteria bacterium]